MDKENSIGVTSNVDYLARHRLLKPGGIDFFAIQMTVDELYERRMFLRRALAAYPRWNNLSNEQLEDIRLYCVGNGYLAEDAKGYVYFLPLGKVTAQETEFRRIHAMMPFEFLNVEAKDFNWLKYRADITEAKKMVNQYIMQYEQFRDKGMGLYIHSGTKGSGKTMLACCVINEIAKRYKGNVKFINVLDFLDMTKKGFKGENEEINAIKQASLLVMYDIGVQMAKEWVDTVFYHLINKRYANRLPTIYTSNIPIEVLHMDDRITDRIESTTFPVKLPEESIRKETRELEKQKLLKEIENGSK